MPAVKDTKLGQMIKAGEFSPVYFLVGEESHLIRKTVGQILKKAVSPEMEQFNCQQFDGEKLLFNDLQTACGALPFMAERKCVTVKNWNPAKLPKADFDAFLKMLSDPNPSTILILFYTAALFDYKKDAKIKRVCAIIEKTGVVCEFALKDKATLRRAVNDRCKRAGVAIAPKLCDRLIEDCGSRFSVIMNEADKLIAYAGQGGEITPESMDMLGIPSVQNTAFDLSNAILKRDYNRAFTILDRLFYLRQEPVMIMGALNMSFIDLYRVKTAQASGCTGDDVIRDFHYRSKFRVQKLYRDSPGFSMEQIRACLESLEKADRLLKSSKMEGRLIMEQMLGEMMSVSFGQ